MLIKPYKNFYDKTHFDIQLIIINRKKKKQTKTKTLKNNKKNNSVSYNTQHTVSSDHRFSLVWLSVNVLSIFLKLH